MNFLDNYVLEPIVAQIRDKKIISIDNISQLVDNNESHKKAVKAFLFLYCLNHVFKATVIQEIDITQSGFGFNAPLDIRFLNEHEQSINIDHMEDNFYLQQALELIDNTLQFMANHLLQGNTVNIIPNKDKSQFKNPILMISDISLQINHQDINYMLKKSIETQQMFQKIDLELCLKDNQKTNKIKI